MLPALNGVSEQFLEKRIATLGRLCHQVLFLVETAILLRVASWKLHHTERGGNLVKPCRIQNFQKQWASELASNMMSKKNF